VELRTKKAGSFIVEGRYYFALSDFYSTTKKDYFARAAHGTITIKLTYLFDLKK
ncbi:PorT family protein, partial [Bacteroides ovatus]